MDGNAIRTDEVCRTLQRLLLVNGFSAEFPSELKKLSYELLKGFCSGAPLICDVKVK